MDDDCRVKKFVWIRALVLLGFLVAVVWLQWRLNLLQYFQPDRIDGTITAARARTENLGLWAPAVFAAVGSLAVLLNAPTALINYLAVILFGYVLGAMVTFLIVAGGISLIYLAAQRLGRPFVKAVFGTRLASMEDRFLKHGLANVTYTRLIFFMTPAANWLLSVSGVRFRDLLFGTLLGCAHSIILNVWFGGLVVDLVRSGRPLNPLKTPLMLLPVGIGVVVFVVLRLIDGRRRSESGEVSGHGSVGGTKAGD